MKNKFITGHIIFFVGLFLPYFSLGPIDLSYFRLITISIKGIFDGKDPLMATNFFPIIFGGLAVLSYLKNRKKLAITLTIFQLLVLIQYFIYIYVEVNKIFSLGMEDIFAGLIIQALEPGFSYGVILLLGGPIFSLYSERQIFGIPENASPKQTLKKTIEVLRLNNIFSVILYILIIIVMIILFH